MTQRRVNVRGIIFKNGQLFAQQLTPDHHGNARDYWCTPGGGLEAGETLYQGLEREMIEETGVKPKIGKLLYIEQFHDGEKEQLEFFFNIENIDDYDHIDLSNTTNGLIETTFAGYVDPSTHNILPAFLQSQDITKDITTDKPVQILSEL